jgi:pimeloyl-ACP methyl ester carboxylesterase
VGSRKKLITIHGVNPDAWQDAVRPLFEPHFDCVALRYSAYDGLSGPVRVVCHPWLLAATLAAALATVAAALWMRAWVLPASAVALLALVLGLGLARLQRRARGTATKREFSLASSAGPRPHVIAHSFGTWLTGQALRHPELAFDRMVLVGSPLPRDYDWGALQVHGRRPFEAVRNEMGSADAVVYLAGLARWVARDLGDAGRRGFVAGAHVHDVDGPWAGCEPCAGAPAARIHNVPLREMGHSDVFLGPGHAKRRGCRSCGVSHRPSSTATCCCATTLPST